ncbi:hypothetical protein J2853_005105 [Streptosporangium lutulentum]|uniref:Uncharacterized protein n=1 Tax=Streptosporangium lutulentum TaxID=1461250 RepID=A0ABT9QGT6_9ACTN|nr:hypothetical protein [Streptosporangium lutulentum]
MTRSLPPRANSGQTSATGAVTSSSPRSASSDAAVAVTAFVHEYTSTGVSLSQARPVCRSAIPPHRSTTGSPSRNTANAAPSSSPSAKCLSNTSRTRENRGSHVP